MTMGRAKAAIFTPPAAQDKRACGADRRNKRDSGVFAPIRAQPLLCYRRGRTILSERLPPNAVRVIPRVEPVHRLLAADSAVPAIAAALNVGDAVRGCAVRMKV